MLSSYRRSVWSRSGLRTLKRKKPPPPKGSGGSAKQLRLCSRLRTQVAFALKGQYPEAQGKLSRPGLSLPWVGTGLGDNDAYPGRCSACPGLRDAAPSGKRKIAATTGPDKSPASVPEVDTTLAQPLDHGVGDMFVEVVANSPWHEAFPTASKPVQRFAPSISVTPTKTSPLFATSVRRSTGTVAAWS